MYMHEYNKEMYIKYQGLSIPHENRTQHRNFFIQNFNLLKPINDIPAAAKTNQFVIPCENELQTEEEKDVQKQVSFNPKLLLNLSELIFNKFLMFS